jgi:PHP family Zn ribbon phosphoesterase
VTKITLPHDTTHKCAYLSNIPLTHKKRKNMSTATQKIHIQDLHLENELWLNEIEFIKIELSLFENKMSYLALANVGNNERMAKLEQLQNQMIRQKEVTDEIKHTVHSSEQDLANMTKELNSIEITHKTFADHSALRDEVQRYKELYQQFKKNLVDFIIHWK